MINKALTCLAFVSLVSGKLVPRTYTSYASKPGQKYSGPTENVVVTDLGEDVSGNVAEQVCSNYCTLSDVCGAFYVQGSSCHKIPVSDKLKTTSTSIYLQPPNYFVKESAVDTPLRAIGTTTTLSNENITTTTTLSSNNGDAPTTTISSDPDATTTTVATASTTTTDNCAAVKLKVHNSCIQYLTPVGSGPPSMGDGCKINLNFEAAGKVNWRLKIRAVNNGVPSKLGKWKIFNNAGDELTEVKAVHLDNPPQTNLKWAEKEKPSFKGWLHLYGTEADPTDIRINYLQWGKDDDANMLSCGLGGV